MSGHGRYHKCLSDTNKSEGKEPRTFPDNDSLPFPELSASISAHVHAAVTEAQQLYARRAHELAKSIPHTISTLPSNPITRALLSHPTAAAHLPCHIAEVVQQELRGNAEQYVNALSRQLAAARMSGRLAVSNVMNRATGIGKAAGASHLLVPLVEWARTQRPGCGARDRQAYAHRTALEGLVAAVAIVADRARFIREEVGDAGCPQSCDCVQSPSQSPDQTLPGIVPSTTCLATEDPSFIATTCQVLSVALRRHYLQHGALKRELLRARMSATAPGEPQLHPSRRHHHHSRHRRTSSRSSREGSPSVGAASVESDSNSSCGTASVGAASRSTRAMRATSLPSMRDVAAPTNGRALRRAHPSLARGSSCPRLASQCPAHNPLDTPAPAIRAERMPRTRPSSPTTIASESRYETDTTSMAAGFRRSNRDTSPQTRSRRPDLMGALETVQMQLDEALVREGSMRERLAEYEARCEKLDVLSRERDEALVREGSMRERLAEYEARCEKLDVLSRERDEALVREGSMRERLAEYEARCEKLDVLSRERDEALVREGSMRERLAEIRSASSPRVDTISRAEFQEMLDKFSMDSESGRLSTADILSKMGELWSQRSLLDQSLSGDAERVRLVLPVIAGRLSDQVGRLREDLSGLRKQCKTFLCAGETTIQEAVGAASSAITAMEKRMKRSAAAIGSTESTEMETCRRRANALQAELTESRALVASLREQCAAKDMESARLAAGMASARSGSRLKCCRSVGRQSTRSETVAEDETLDTSAFEVDECESLARPNISERQNASVSPRKVTPRVPLQSLPENQPVAHDSGKASVVDYSVRSSRSRVRMSMVDSLLGEVAP